MPGSGERTRSVQIRASGLWLGDYFEERVALAAVVLPTDPGALDDLDMHVHGHLRIEVAGRELPHLGYWGPDDVCLHAWVPELVAIRAALSSPTGRHVYDEGEQGQPAFVFEREGDHAFVSIEASHIGDGPADPEWQRVRCDAADFVHAIDAFLEALERHVSAAGPYGVRWWAVMRERHLSPASGSSPISDRSPSVEVA